ncbi:peptide deformylase [Streptomyces sp. NBC_00237]|uniref:peptide deformylase n=1 Tax=Streptomyces sp. NBC_00237 TaxID=2975687 RepID=UPI00225B7819|nr:peptide deformylase [Streptomyces sp. NBC_00237]MCX5201130.1 peptide deformylase [Streptomyces sp. NBC_00237]
MEQQTRTGEVHDIVLRGNPVLHQPCQQVVSFDTALAQLIDDMFATMYAADGVGLAANQIGVPRRVFVYDCPDTDGRPQRGHVVNPVLRSINPGDQQIAHGDEGCLSAPDRFALLARPEYAIVDGVDLHGKPVTVEATGWLARCLQHETDHLNGILFTDRVHDTQDKP